MNNRISYSLFNRFPEILCLTIWNQPASATIEETGQTAFLNTLLDHPADAISGEGWGLAKQVHGKDIRDCRNPGTYDSCDGLMTTQKKLPLIIRTADCAAVMIYDARSKRIANLHVGWRGARAGIISAAVRKMLGEEEQSNASDLWVAVAPMILPCCYQVGEEFYSYFEESHLQQREDGVYLDLPQVIAQQLGAHGILVEQVQFSEECTFCSPLNLPSFRRDRTQNRIYNMIERRENVR